MFIYNKNMSESEEKYILDNLEKYLINENNINITKKYIKSVLSIIKDELKINKIKYSISNINLYVEAMTHKSYLKTFAKNERNVKFLVQTVKNRNIQPIEFKNDIIGLKDTCYERLEYLGDSVIRLIVAEYLYKRYPDQCEGFLTKLKTKIENNESLAKLSKSIGLHDYMIIAKYVDLNNARSNEDIGILCDVFESFIGALFLDSGCDLNVCRLFIIKLIETKIDIASLLFNEDNYKDILLRYFHKMKWQDPIYETLDIIEIGDNKKKSFIMCIKDNNNKIVGKGSGSSKKKGEQLAAKHALERYGELLSEYSDESEMEFDSDIDL